MKLPYNSQRSYADKLATWQAAIDASGLHFPDTWHIQACMEAIRRQRTQAQINEQEQYLVWYRYIQAQQHLRRLADDARFEGLWNDEYKQFWKREGFKV